jgi:hypothetical protein
MTRHSNLIVDAVQEVKFGYALARAPLECTLWNRLRFDLRTLAKHGRFIKAGDEPNASCEPVP